LNPPVFDELPAPPRTPEELVLLGLLVRRLRHGRGWSQSMLAGRADVPQSTISRLERGQRPGLRADSLARVLYALGLFEDVDEVMLSVAKRHRMDGFGDGAGLLAPWRRWDRIAARAP
jgi:transcriptional regulator with XRE-family HTH domain